MVKAVVKDVANSGQSRKLKARAVVKQFGQTVKAWSNLAVNCLPVHPEGIKAVQLDLTSGDQGGTT